MIPTQSRPARCSSAARCAAVAAVMLLIGCPPLHAAHGDDGGLLRALLIAHAGADFPPADRVKLIGGEHRNVTITSADANGAKVHSGDFDATLPWRVLDPPAICALSSALIDKADDASLAAWLKIAATITPRDREFRKRLDRLGVVDPALASSLESGGLPAPAVVPAEPTEPKVAKATVAETPVDPASMVPAMPTTEAEYRKIKGKEIVVDLHSSEVQTRIMVPARAHVAIIPNPTDKWACIWDMADPTPVDWHGDMGQAEGMTKQLQIKAYPLGGAMNGKMQYDFPKDKTRNAWIDVADLPDHIWTGPGMLSFRGALRAAQGNGRGTIRVKLVTLP